MTAYNLAVCFTPNCFPEYKGSKLAEGMFALIPQQALIQKLIESSMVQTDEIAQENGIKDQNYSKLE